MLTREESRTRRIALGLAAVIAVIWAGLYLLGHTQRQSKGVIAYAHTSTIFGGPGTVGQPLIITAFHPPTTTKPTLDARVQEIVALVESQTSTAADSEVTRLNAHASDAPFAVSPELAEMLACAWTVGEQTAGAFDITTSGIAHAYQAALFNSARLTENELTELRAHAGLAKLQFDPQAATVRKLDPATLIGLDALRCGFTLDRIVRLFEEIGADKYDIAVGPVSYTRERDRAKIRNPDGTRRPMQIAAAVLPEQEIEPPFGQHAIDGRTGSLAAKTPAEVTVLHEQGLWAEAYARAIWVLGADDGLLLAKLLKLPVQIREKDGTLRTSEAYQARFGTQ